MKMSYRITMTAVLALLLCTAASAQVVINEIDYDQVSTDTAEFLELYNAGTETVDLTGYSLVFYSGTGASSYRTVDLTGFSLAAGEFFVVCSNGATTPLCDLDLSVSNMIQNGAPDSVALLNGANMVDSVSYEGTTTGVGEGTPAPGDSNSISFVGISRVPNGFDTDDNGTDFMVSCVTPGEANVPYSGACGDPVPSDKSEWGTIKAMFR